MAEIGIMIEGQEDLTWDRFFKLAETVEALGYASMFRSDHLTALEGFPQRASLALWPSLTALAIRTRRIRFGPMVCPITFRHPVMLAKMAAAVDQLSGGRLDLGLGAGWYGGEHRMFGVGYPSYGTRLEMLDEGAQVIKRLWSGQPASYNGKHYQLVGAETHPAPAQAEPTIIMGGKGEKTLQVVARHATEWNFSYERIGLFRQKSAQLDENCRAIGRDPGTLKRSLMLPFVIGRDELSIQNRINAHRSVFPSLPATLADWLAAGYLGGRPQQLADQIMAFVEAGIERFMLQHNDLDDLDSLELFANELLPQFN
ncbi:MAG: TIGR03560 family F420-dependent LLM class oxidoreductase [Chloroflexota bacterium]|nr:MAG: TIGR03560 family F420-dependent LLM class oxidoreductase [Chloroflexota bacterium]